jgi:hypothetical protein
MLTDEQLDVLGLAPETRFTRKSSHISQALRSIPADAASDFDPVDGGDEGVLVRPINGDQELDAVYHITHDSYAERGYCQPRPERRLIHYPHLDRISETTVLVAILKGQIVGTTSWTLDGPRGLPSDSDFKAECDAVRREGRRLAAGWRIATTSRCRAERKVVMTLIHETLRSELDSGVTTCLFTFHPRHENIYRKLLNMRTVARSEGTRGLNNAPAVLMRLDREAVPERWISAMVAG